jgi:DNA-directed RNA polymerase sigma subunit (sigma70/sigma32)
MVRDAVTAQVTTLSLDEPTAHGATIGQFLAAQSLPVEDLVIDALHGAHVLRQVRELLDADDWRLLCLRFGLDGAAQRSNALVAAAVDLPLETARRRIVAVLERLRAVLA